MHLLMETAIGDSKAYGVLSYDELEDLKRERSTLTSRVDATRRKLALESKLRDAAQSLNRLYSTKGRRESADSSADPTSPNSPRKHRRTFLGSRNSNADTISRTDDEFAASSRKCDELSNEVFTLEKRLEDVQRRVLEHTAGVLQMTHKGLKKNLRKGELPRSPESMMSLNNRNVAGLDGIDDFDERSFYRSTDLGEEHDRSLGGLLNGKSQASGEQMQALHDAEQRLMDLNTRLRDMILRADPDQKIEPPPHPAQHDPNTKQETQLRAHLGYLAVGLDTIEANQARTIQDAQKSVYDSEHLVEDLNMRLHDMLEKTNSTGQGPLVMPVDPTRKDVQTQLNFATIVVERLSQRLQVLVEQKDILTKQVQQQRELNSKSDAQRDDQILELTNELAEAKRLQSIDERETQASQDQINLLMEQLESARQEAALLGQQRGMSSDKALQAEKEARQQTEANLHAQLQSRQDQCNQLQSRMTGLQNDLEIQAQNHILQVNDLTNVKASADTELQRCRTEMKELESEVVRVQTDLTVVRAELDGAYGTRAQRAADVSMNPAIQKEIDDLSDKNIDLQQQISLLGSQKPSSGAGDAELQNKVEVLQRELKETIEDYEVMTRASIEFEKERDQLDALIDSLRERNETLEAQLSDEKVRLLGMKSSGPGQGGPTESTSTMVLKNEFKKMMRDTRTENIKSLRVSGLIITCATMLTRTTG